MLSKQRVGRIGVGLMGHGAAKASIQGHGERFMPVLPGILAELNGCSIRDLEADAIGDEPVWHDGKVVGWITLGGYGHCVGQSIVLGYVPAALAQASEGFEVEILGERRRASLATQARYDPAGGRMRRS